MDSVDRETRSKIMSRIRQRGSAMEREFVKAIRGAGIKYRKNVRIYGTPDMILVGSKILIFLDSCFWHGCRYHCRKPKSNTPFWNREKLTRNRRRDAKVTRFYRKRGFVVLRFWEHQIRKDLNACIDKVRSALNPVNRAQRIRSVHKRSDQ